MTDTLAFPAATLATLTAAAIYGFGFLNAEISHWRSFWKTLPVAIMALFAAATGGGWLLATALGLSAVGDYFLSRDETKFTIGLVSFLAAHLLYIWIFWHLAPRASLGWPHIAMGAYAVLYGRYLWPRAGEFRIPVLAYILVITAMVSTAFLLPAPYGAVIAGSLAFALSDSLLALEMFVVSAPRTKVLLSKMVWVSYIMAQGLLVVGLMA